MGRFKFGRPGLLADFDEKSFIKSQNAIHTRGEIEIMGCDQSGHTGRAEHAAAMPAWLSRQGVSMVGIQLEALC